MCSFPIDCLYIPTDCLHIILGYMFIDDVINTCLGLCQKEQFTEVLRRRVSPLVYFSQLVDSPRDLLYSMCASKCVLGGSRAAEYVRPGSCTSESDWDFYIRGTKGDTDWIHMTMKDNLSSMGVEWVPSAEKDYAGMSFTLATGHIQTKGRRHTIQLIYTGKHAPISSIIMFHSTPVQCMLTHLGAFHMYGSLSKLNAQVVWHGNIQQRTNRIHTYNMQICTQHRIQGSLEDEVEELGYDGTVDVIKESVEVVTQWIQDFISITSHPSAGINEHHESLRLYIHGNVEQGLLKSYGNEASVVMAYLIRHRYSSIVIAGRSRCMCIQRRELDAVEKYKYRGYTVMDKSDYTTYSKDWKDISTGKPYRIRSIGDSESTIFPFYKYTGMCSDTLARKHIHDIASFRWAEFADKTSTVGMYSYSASRSESPASSYEDSD